MSCAWSFAGILPRGLSSDVCCLPCTAVRLKDRQEGRSRSSGPFLAGTLGSFAPLSWGPRSPRPTPSSRTDGGDSPYSVWEDCLLPEGLSVCVVTCARQEKALRKSDKTGAAGTALSDVTTAQTHCAGWGAGGPGVPRAQHPASCSGGLPRPGLHPCSLGAGPWQPLISFTISTVVPLPDATKLDSFSTLPFQVGFFHLVNQQLRVVQVFSWPDSTFLFYC